MNKDSKAIAPEIAAVAKRSELWMDALAGLLAGFVGGLLCKAALGSWTTRHFVLASLFGLVFGFFFSKRATSPGAGLIWSLGFAFFLWLAVPAGLGHLLSGSRHAESMFGDAQEHFPELVAYLVCLGMPVGLILGSCGAIRGKTIQSAFSWGRAIIVGGFSGLLGGTIFGRWMSSGDFFPLLGGLGVIHSHDTTVALHFGIAILIGATYGLLFQRDVRGFGSSMGWGLGYGIFWWFFGPLTMLPLVKRAGLDWSSDRGTALFGSLVGHILYGLIVGVAYATVDRLWVRLFIQSDPLNREPEGPGLRLFRSLRWGAFAGLVGGLVASPILFATGVLSSDSCRTGLYSHGNHEYGQREASRAASEIWDDLSLGTRRPRHLRRFFGGGALEGQPSALTPGVRFRRCVMLGTHGPKTKLADLDRHTHHFYELFLHCYAHCLLR